MNITLDKGHLGGQNRVLGKIRDFCTSICGVMHSTRDTNTETTREIEYTRDDFFKSCVTFFMLFIIKTGRKISANWNTEINGQDRVIYKVFCHYCMCWKKCHACLHSLTFPKSSRRSNRFLIVGVLSQWDVHTFLENMRINDVSLNINITIHLMWLIWNLKMELSLETIW